MTVHIDTVDTELSVLPGGEGGAADPTAIPSASPWAADLRRFLAARRRRSRGSHRCRGIR